MSTNISKKKRDDLLDKIKQIRAFIAAAPQDENTGNLLSYLSELEKDVNGKKYGLVFEEHREEIDEVLDTHTPVLTEDADLFIDHGVQMNFLIEGDNLASLQLLEKTHKGKIDLIYIDPPYNTGAKDFVYDDAFVDTTDGFNHSKWLSFMKQRLSLSKKLLAAHGTIFISIDDNEFSQLKLLCDEVFGANNYVGTILWKKKTNGNNMGWLPPVHDYILCYSKEIGKIYDFGFEVSEEDILKNYSNPDNDPRGPWTTTDLSANHKGPYFPVTNPKTGDVYYPPAGRYWVFNEQEIQRRIADGRIIFGKSGMARPVQRVFAKDRKFSKRKVESWWDNHGMNADATQELKDIFGVAKVFTHPKPTQLIKDIVKMSCSKTATILDFFAGSGTTGHAVMNLNAEDGGTRRFILCTNNENGICRDVTYERIRRVIDMDLSWLKNFDAESLARSYEQRAQITIADMRRKIENCDTGKLTKDAGEYVVSELAREAIVSELNYLDIPLAELLGKKISGNPGFDFHSQNNATNTVIFGEAKYVTAHSGYPRAIDQIKAFVDDKKDIADIADLRDFCSADALSRVVDGFKGFAAAFSAKSTPSDRLISAITAKDSFQELLKYEEVILVAVNL